MLLDRGQSSPKSVPREKEPPSRRSSASAAPGPPGPPLKRLRSSCVVVRMDDLDIHQASSTNHRSPLDTRRCSLRVENNGQSARCTVLKDLTRAYGGGLT